ncbi:phage tail protein [Enterobacter ludwigii]|uniref:phage tail-collar fiber domain-containing protein n=1 Tax=Enterobacter ludwigii TaxID=299767 RepID=UPI001BA87237|nr:phage tail protein [Enterobacter ludwigii]MBS0870330.1 phage tail protein [Enterobacter ludwigii]
MTVKYKTVITKAGAIKLAAATIPGGKKVNFTAMAVGDGGGTLPTPDPNQTKLVKEVWRHALNKVSQDRKTKNYVVAELLIPPETGGFWMRELGLYDDTGTLIAVGNMAESYKPALAEGSGRAQTVRMVIMVSDIESVELTIDTSTVMATQDYVDDKLAEHEQSRRHPDATLTAKGFTQLSNATDSTSETVAATPKAVKAAYDLAKGKYTAQDATTAQKGIVQLSSVTNSSSEALAATPKAVKAAYDLANGKYTAQDATTTQKGIVQLSSATDSQSETMAATPKAVSVAVKNLKDTLGTSAYKDIVTSMTDKTAGRVPVVGWMGLGVDNSGSGCPVSGGIDYVSEPTGIWQATNELTTGTFPPDTSHYGTLFRMRGSANDVSQLYFPGASVANGGNIYFRQYDAVSMRWGSWYKIYSEFSKPTPAEIGALDRNGNAVSASKLLTARTISGVPFDGTSNITLSADNVGAYSKTESDGRFQPKGNYTPAGQAYTKAESDARFQKINTASKADNGWFKDTNTGMIIQWGIQSSGGNGTFGVTFPVAFPSAAVSVSMTRNASNDSPTCSVYNVSRTGFTARQADGGSGGSYWMAIGY